MTAKFYLPEDAPAMDAQLAIHTGNPWLWQSGVWITGTPGKWTEVSIDLTKCKDLNVVHRFYLLIRSPLKGYKGRIYLDDVKLYPKK